MEAEYIKPLEISDPSEFPHDNYVPEGCVVLEDVEDEFGYQVNYKDVIYAEREIDGEIYPLHLLIYEPTLNVDETTEEERARMKWPIIVFVQGSAWHKQVLHYRMGTHIRMAEKGFIVAVVQYRPSEVSPFPAQMQDCKTAIRYMRKHAADFHGDADRIALWGDSSGGHTVLLAGITGDDEPDSDLYREYSCSVRCIIDWFGPVDFAKMSLYPSILDHRDADSPEGYEIGHINVWENIEANDRCSPVTYLSAKKEIPPILIMHGGNDMLVPFRQSCLIYEKLKELGKDVIFVKLKHANHGFAGFNNIRTLKIVEDYIRRNI